VVNRMTTDMRLGVELAPHPLGQRIIEITPGTILHDSGKILLNDVILSINGETTVGPTASDLPVLLTAVGEVTFVVGRGGPYLVPPPCPPLPHESGRHSAVPMVIAQYQTTQQIHVPLMLSAKGPSRIEQVTPICSCFCGYCAITPSVACVETDQCLCCNCNEGCCVEANEGCVLKQSKCWVTCTKITCCRRTGNCCCVAHACAVPCHVDIPCRLTICCCTLCGTDGFGGCKTVHHTKGLHGAGGPQVEDMMR